MVKAMQRMRMRRAPLNATSAEAHCPWLPSVAPGSFSEAFPASSGLDSFPGLESVSTSSEHLRSILLWSKGGSTRRSKKPVARPNTEEAVSSESTPSSTFALKPPPSRVTCTSLALREKRMRTAMSLSTVMPMDIFAAFDVPHLSSETTAMMLAGLRAVMRADTSSATAPFDQTVGCRASAGLDTQPLLTRSRRPGPQNRSVKAQMRSTCSAMGASRSSSSGTKISAPAAPAMKARATRLMMLPIRRMCIRETRFVA
mmetsp:Transcript_101337/g.295173  ORF Transcript_101337/g.295173 Transcript_101337/m.295173 type:complete len:257 (-) Transcript_101337:758-1528(-)